MGKRYSVIGPLPKCGTIGKSCTNYNTMERTKDGYKNNAGQ
jgi:hypothetical protein